MRRERTPEEKAGLVSSSNKRRRIEQILFEIERGIQRPPATTPERIKGQKTEERFFEAWAKANKAHYPKWLKEVLPATVIEDLGQATDALFYTRGGRRLRIQIKSSSYAAEIHRKKHRFIPAIVILEGDDENTIRQKTLDAIKEVYEI